MKSGKNIFKLSRSQWIGVAVLASSMGLAAAVTVPNIFVPNTPISASQMNANFAALGNFGSILSVVRVQAPTPDIVTHATASCPAGRFATGGGCAINTATAASVVKIDEPVVIGTAPTGWTCACQAPTSPSGQTCGITATAICTAP
jgi:hypothetical protein